MYHFSLTDSLHAGQAGADGYQTVQGIRREFQRVNTRCSVRNWARSSTVERPPCTREAPGSNPGESIGDELACTCTEVLAMRVARRYESTARKGADRKEACGSQDRNGRFHQTSRSCGRAEARNDPKETGNSLEGVFE